MGGVHEALAPYLRSVRQAFAPVVFYAFIESAELSSSQGTQVTFGAYFLESMAVYSVANVMISASGSRGTERGMKTALLMRATPTTPSVYLLVGASTAIVFAALTLAVLFPFAYIAGGVRLEAEQGHPAYRVLSDRFHSSRWVRNRLHCPPQLGRAVINLIYLPTAFASGLFFPKQLLPEIISRSRLTSSVSIWQLGWTRGSATSET